jgi:hypothetical protein
MGVVRLVHRPSHDLELQHSDAREDDRSGRTARSHCALHSQQAVGYHRIRCTQKKTHERARSRSRARTRAPAHTRVLYSLTSRTLASLILSPHPCITSWRAHRTCTFVSTITTLLSVSARSRPTRITFGSFLRSVRSSRSFAARFDSSAYVHEYALLLSFSLSPQPSIRTCPPDRSLAVHPTLPLVLSSSDDVLIKLWDWEKGEIYASAQSASLYPFE